MYRCLYITEIAKQKPKQKIVHIPSINKERLSQLPNSILLIERQQFLGAHTKNGAETYTKNSNPNKHPSSKLQDSRFISLNLKLNHPFPQNRPAPQITCIIASTKINIINLKTQKINEVLLSTPHYSLQYLYYVCIPSHQTIPQDITTEGPSFKEIPTPPEEERPIFTREDLEKQGYGQTKRPWTAEEDKLLIKLCRDQHARFDEVASKVEGRNAKMCYSRYRRLTYETRAIWTRQQDQSQLVLVEQHGDDAWRAIAAHFEGCSHKQLKDHPFNYLKPDLLKSEWNIEEDL